MDFTREPIIETIITPKEGFKLVIRSTKNIGQEEYLVDAVEVVSFGKGCFLRSLERPKSFLVPASDFEVLEVKEARMVLKNISQDRSIKIGGGREGQNKGAAKEAEKAVNSFHEEPKADIDHSKETEKGEVEANSELRLDKKRDRRRNYRKRRGNENAETQNPEEKSQEIPDHPAVEELAASPESSSDQNTTNPIERTSALPLSVLSSLLQPPSTLISETINQYRQNELFKTAFFLTEEDQYKPHDQVNDLLNEEESYESMQHHGHPDPDDLPFHPVTELVDTDETMLKFDTEAALPLFEEEEKVHSVEHHEIEQIRNGHEDSHVHNENDKKDVQFFEKEYLEEFQVQEYSQENEEYPKDHAEVSKEEKSDSLESDNSGHNLFVSHDDSKQLNHDFSHGLKDQSQSSEKE